MKTSAPASAPRPAGGRTGAEHSTEQTAPREGLIFGVVVDEVATSTGGGTVNVLRRHPGTRRVHRDERQLAHTDHMRAELVIAYPMHSLVQQSMSAWCSLHSATTAHLTCRYALRVMVNIPRRSEWWRSAALTAGPCVSLLEIGKPTTACLVGHRAQPG